MPESASNADSEPLAALSKTTLAELRAAHGDMAATREAFLRFFQRGFNAGLSVEDCMRLLFFEPWQAGSLFRRVGYADHEYESLVRVVRELPLMDVLAQKSRAEPVAPPNGGPPRHATE
jgi:hypothetical protein